MAKLVRRQMLMIEPERSVGDQDEVVVGEVDNECQPAEVQAAAMKVAKIVRGQMKRA